MYKQIINELYKHFHNIRTYIYVLIIAVVNFSMLLIIRVGVNRGLDINYFNFTQYPVIVFIFMADFLFPLLITLVVMSNTTEEINGGTYILPILTGATKNTLIQSKILANCIMLLFLIIISFISGWITAILFIPEKTDMLYCLSRFFCLLFPHAAYVPVISFICIKMKSSGGIIGLVSTILIISIVFGNMGFYAMNFWLFYQLKYITDAKYISHVYLFIIISLAYYSVFYHLSSRSGKNLEL